LSRDSPKDSLIATVDRLLEIHIDVTRKETDKTPIIELKKDLVELREVLTEFNAAVLKFAFSEPGTDPEKAKRAADILTKVVGKSILNSRDVAVAGIVSIELAIADIRDPDRMTSSIASIIANSMVSNGCIEGLKNLRQVLLLI